jgi:hypothetical protein
MAINCFMYLLGCCFFIVCSGIISAVIFHIAKYSEFLGFVIGLFGAAGLIFAFSSAVSSF